MTQDTHDHVADVLLGGETAEQVLITPDEQTPEHWLITVNYGWAQTIVARCDYLQHARGVGLALAYSLDCDLTDLNPSPVLPAKSKEME